MKMTHRRLDTTEQGGREGRKVVGNTKSNWQSILNTKIGPETVRGRAGGRGVVQAGYGGYLPGLGQSGFETGIVQRLHQHHFSTSRDKREGVVAKGRLCSNGLSWESTVDNDAKKKRICGGEGAQSGNRGRWGVTSKT